MSTATARYLAALFGAATLWLAGLLLPATAASALTSEGSSSIGVVVDPVPTTEPPPAQPPVTQAPPVKETTPTPTTPEAPAGNVAPTETTTVVPEFRPADPEPVIADKSIVETVTGAFSATAKGATKIFKDVLSGKPVAEAFQSVLPESAASVVVPAVRTASTFVFPIGLAGGVFGFLILQQRIDSTDPKLTAAPLAHDDDEIEFR